MGGVMDAEAKRELDLCKVEARTRPNFREAIPEIVHRFSSGGR